MPLNDVGLTVGAIRDGYTVSKVINAATGRYVWQAIAGTTANPASPIDKTPAAIPASLTALQAAVDAAGKPAGEVWIATYGTAPNYETAKVVGSTWVDAAGGVTDSIESPNLLSHVDATNPAITFTVDGHPAGGVVWDAINGFPKWTLNGTLDPVAYSGTPRTIAQRDALTPAAGWLVYIADGTVNEYQMWDGATWVSLGADPQITLWTSGATYAGGDMVYIADRLYIADGPHTAGATFAGDIGSWRELSRAPLTVFAPNAVVNPAIPGAPTEAEIGAVLGAFSAAAGNVFVRYNGTATSTNPATYVFWVDSTGAVTLLRSPATTAGVMTGATSSTAGTSGLTTTPAAGSQDLVLHADGLWRQLFPNWTASTPYSAGAPVYQNSKIYRRIAAGASGLAFNAAEEAAWQAIADLGGTPTLYLTNTAVAPAAAGSPTVAEITTAAGTTRDALLVYNRTDNPVNQVTHVWHIDQTGAVTLLRSPDFGLGPMTTVQRDALTGLLGGEVIYNTTTGTMQWYRPSSGGAPSTFQYTGGLVAGSATSLGNGTDRYQSFPAPTSPASFSSLTVRIGGGVNSTVGQAKIYSGVGGGGTVLATSNTFAWPVAASSATVAPTTITFPTPVNLPAGTQWTLGLGVVSPVSGAAGTWWLHSADFIPGGSELLFNSGQDMSVDVTLTSSGSIPAVWIDLTAAGGAPGSVTNNLAAAAGSITSTINGVTGVLTPQPGTIDPTKHLGFDAAGALVLDDITAATTLYTADSALAGPRTVTMAGNDLTFDGTGDTVIFDAGVVEATGLQLHTIDTIPTGAAPTFTPSAQASNRVIIDNTSTGTVSVALPMSLAPGWQTGTVEIVLQNADGIARQVTFDAFYFGADGATAMAAITLPPNAYRTLVFRERYDLPIHHWVLVQNTGPIPAGTISPTKYIGFDAAGALTLGGATDEIIETAGALTGAAPAGAQWGVDTTTGQAYYVAAGNWAAIPGVHVDLNFTVSSQTGSAVGAAPLAPPPAPNPGDVHLEIYDDFLVYWTRAASSWTNSAQISANPNAAIAVSPASTDTTGAVGTSALYARQDHRHPTEGISANAGQLLTVGTDGLHLYNGRDRLFLSSTLVAAAIPASPTIAEITTAVGTNRNVIAYYNGGTVSTSGETHVYYVDRAGLVTTLKSPSAASGGFTSTFLSTAWTPVPGATLSNLAVSTSGTGTAAGTERWQAFTATASGVINGVTIRMQVNSGATTMRVRLYAGSGIAGTVLGDTSVTISNAAMANVFCAFPTPPTVATGSVYTVGFVATAGSGVGFSLVDTTLPANDAFPGFTASNGLFGPVTDAHMSVVISPSVGAGGTFTIPAATHGLGVGYHHVTVFDTANDNVLVTTNVNPTTGDVTLRTTGSAFSGSAYITR